MGLPSPAGVSGWQPRACKATGNAPWDAPVGIGRVSSAGFGCTDHASTSILVSVPGRAEPCQQWCGLGGRAACLALAASPCAAGWHQMKTNGLGDTLASINGSTVPGSAGETRRCWQEQRQLPGRRAEHRSPGPGTPTVGSRGAGGLSGAGAALGLLVPTPWLCPQPEPAWGRWQGQQELDGVQPRTGSPSPLLTPRRQHPAKFCFGRLKRASAPTRYFGAQHTSPRPGSCGNPTFCWQMCTPRGEEAMNRANLGRRGRSRVLKSPRSERCSSGFCIGVSPTQEEAHGRV